MSGTIMKSIKPRKQRKELFNAPQHKKRRWASSHLEESLLLKYDKRSVPVIRGDTVKVLRGSFRGHEDKVVNVNVKKQTLEIEGIHRHRLGPAETHSPARADKQEKRDDDSPEKVDMSKGIERKAT